MEREEFPQIWKKGCVDIRILLADDQQSARESVRALLEKEDDMDVVGEAADGQTAVRLARELQPDIVIMDVVMPIMNGIEATRQIVAEVPGVKIIAFSMHSRKTFVKGMLKAGASGYVLKNCMLEELTRAIRTVVSNRVYVSPAIAGIAKDR